MTQLSIRVLEVKTYAGAEPLTLSFLFLVFHNFLYSILPNNLLTITLIALAQTIVDLSRSELLNTSFCASIGVGTGVPVAHRSCKPK